MLLQLCFGMNNIVTWFTLGLNCFSDALIVTCGAMVHACLDVAERLAEVGADIEVIDLRSLAPQGDVSYERSENGKIRCSLISRADEY